MLPGKLSPFCRWIFEFFHSILPFSSTAKFLNHMITSCFLNSQSSLTGESMATEKTADIREDQSTPLLELKNICFMVGMVIPVVVLFVVEVIAWVIQTEFEGSHLSKLQIWDLS